MSANLGVLSRDRNQLRIPNITPADEVLLFVDLAQVTSHTPEQIEAMAKELGYSPGLRIAEYKREGRSLLEPVLLIYQASARAVSDELLTHWEYFASEVQPATAVHLRSGQPLESFV
jgi:hypothetical protein